ncbi:hypothetical protein [Streptomyces sp. 8L]|uniref:hypothetical protein n=1 Tax=Streptomyces sp. 8L TaxID=2877242 RepID=UPI001CD7EBAF|nr:hypothetical protein [Streptomyces sp. 8L]MCA1223545.1 hypothetical protein [Streptomyces sp. 8L]
MAEVDKTRSTTMTDAGEISPGNLFVGGTWREASDGVRRDVVSPETGTVITDIAWTTTSDVDDAVAAARSSFESGVWSQISGRGALGQGPGNLSADSAPAERFACAGAALSSKARIACDTAGGFEDWPTSPPPMPSARLCRCSRWAGLLCACGRALVL